MTVTPSILEVRGLRSGYGDTQILQGVDLTVPAGTGAAVLGRNGMGKTTLLQTLMGFVSVREGTIHVDGQDVTGQPIHHIARAGLRLVPQGRRVFRSLSVAETLDVAARSLPGEWDLDRVYSVFPVLYDRRSQRSDLLSGGEQEMLVLARALLGNPKCLLLDEPSDGLAPKVVEQVSDIVRGLRADGLSVVLVEQNLQLAVTACEEVYCLVRGQVAWRGDTETFRNSREVATQHLGVGT